MLNIKLLVKQYYKSTNFDVVTDGGLCVSAPSDVQVARSSIADKAIYLALTLFFFLMCSLFIWPKT